MTDAQVTELTNVLLKLSDLQGKQVDFQRQFLEILTLLHKELAKYDITSKERSEVCSRVRTALSLDNPDLWHDALVSVLATLDLPKGG